MARQYAPLQTSIWRDSDFIALSSCAQRLFMVAVSQPNMSWCGVVPFTSRRWASFAPDTTARNVNRSVDELVASDFVVLDEGTEELWVRSFIKHNVVAQPKLIQAAQREFREIHSDEIREALLLVYPWASGTPGEPLPKASSEIARTSVLGVGVKGQGSTSTENPSSENTNTNTDLTPETIAEYAAEAERQADAWLARDSSSISDRAGWVAKRITNLTSQYGADGLPKKAGGHLRLVCINPDCREGIDYSTPAELPCEECKAARAS